MDKIVISVLVIILIAVTSCTVGISAYEQTLLESCKNKSIVTLLISKINIKCAIINKKVNYG